VSGGKRLSGSLLATLEQRIGAPLSDVRIHTDARAAQAADAAAANAFTIGRDIFFAPGKFAPDTQAGARRLAHELVHAEQQRSARSGRSHASDDTAEREARELGAAVAAGARVTVRTAAAHAIQREDRNDPAGEFVPRLRLDPEIERLAFQHYLRWWLGTTLVEGEAPTSLRPSLTMSAAAPGLPFLPIVSQLPLRPQLFSPLPPDPLYLQPDVGALFSGFGARGAPVGEGDAAIVFDLYRRNQEITRAMPDLRAMAPGFLRPLIPNTWRRDIAGALTSAAVGASLKRDYMTPIEVSDRAWEAMTGVSTTMIPLPALSF